MLPRGSGIRTEKKRGALRARTGPEGRQGTAHAVCDAADRSGGEAFAGRGAGAGGRQLHALRDDGNDQYPRRHRPGGRPPRPEGSPGGPDRGHRGRERTVPGGLTASSARPPARARSEEHTSELQSRENLVCRLLLEKKKKTYLQ